LNMKSRDQITKDGRSLKQKGRRSRSRMAKVLLGEGKSKVRDRNELFNHYRGRKYPKKVKERKKLENVPRCPEGKTPIR